MDSRTRTFGALQRRSVGGPPIDVWATEAVKEQLAAHQGLSYEALLDQYDVDLRYIEGPRYVGPELAPGEDIWGVKRHSVASGDAGGETYQECTQSPLADIEDLDAIDRYAHWPHPDWYDYSDIEHQCETILERGRVVVFMGDRLNRIAQLKPAMYVRGTTDIFLDMAARPRLAHSVFHHIRTFYMGYLERILEAAKGKIDIILTGDDFGAQNGLLVSPFMWRSFVQPGFEEYNRLIHVHGARVMHHTCGAVAELIPDMIESGLDILQSLQPEAAGMSLDALKRAYGDRLCFHGGISIQQLMPFGTPDDIHKEVARIAELFRADGGYIFCTAHNLQADTPLENVLALLEAYQSVRS